MGNDMVGPYNDDEENWEQPEWHETWDCEVVDAPDGSAEVRAHPDRSATDDDRADDFTDPAYWRALDTQAGQTT